MRALSPLAVAVLLAGCGSGADDGAGRAGDPVSVREAIERGTEAPQRVRGYVLERGGVARLCEAILESYPPQCGEPSLRLEGDVEVRPEEPVELLGTVEGDAFRAVSEP